LSKSVIFRINCTYKKI